MDVYHCPSPNLPFQRFDIYSLMNHLFIFLPPIYVSINNVLPDLELDINENHNYMNVLLRYNLDTGNSQVLNVQFDEF